VRYILEQGLIPEGVDQSPGRGEHRQLRPKEAYWLALVLVLKGNGLRAPLAAQIADHLRISVRIIAANLGWDSTFHPFSAKFETECEWFADLAELRYVRVVTNSDPSHRALIELPWHEIGARKQTDITPVVYIRIDLAGLARKLKE
jgi:hypothetical protein